MLFIREYGNPQNPLLIFLHGFLGSHQDFNPLLSYLEKDFFCIVPDLPGHSSSKNVPFHDDDSFESILMESLKPYLKKPFTLIGYSMGGRIALQLFPKLNYQSLILISCQVFPLLLEEKKDREIIDQKKIKKLQKDSFSNFLNTWYNQPLFCTLKERPNLYSMLIQSRKKEDPQIMAQVMKILSPATLPDPKAFLDHYQKPLLYFSGLCDTRYQKEALRVRKHFQRAWLIFESHTSHALHLEVPQSLSQHIKHFYRYYHDRMDPKAAFKPPIF